MRIVAALILGLALQAAAPDRFSQLDTRIEQMMKAAGVPGAAIAVVKDGAVLHTRGFGVTSVETNAPVTSKTLFRLGSTTKMFVALAVLKLADEGKLRLDQPVGELVPGLSAPFGRVTVEQLLTHTAGLAEDAPMNGPLDESALHARVAGWDESAFFAMPGEIFSYANPGYVLLGDVIAHVTKQPFSAAMQALVLKPAGMQDSTFRPLEAFTRPVALGHDAAGVIRPFAEHAGNYPPGSLFTSAEDLGRVLSTLAPATLERLAQPRASIVAQGRDYGYGVVIDRRRGSRLVLHTGGRTGYGSIFLIAPAERVAVAVLASRTGATLSGAAFAALEPYVPLTEVQTPSTPVPLSREQAAALAGTYVNGPLTVVVMVDEGGTLAVRIGGKALPAVAVGEDRFYVKGGGQLETFVIVRDAQRVPRFLCAETWALRKRS
jgi:CubicO group peptidase (beta-lactamase class C family)